MSNLRKQTRSSALKHDADRNENKSDTKEDNEASKEQRWPQQRKNDATTKIKKKCHQARKKNDGIT